MKPKDIIEITVPYGIYKAGTKAIIKSVFDYDCYVNFIKKDGSTTRKLYNVLKEHITVINE